MDELNKIIYAIEDEFQKQPHVRAHVLVDGSDERNQIYLAWGKLANQWKFILEMYDGEKLYQQIGLRESPMEFRLKAPDFFGPLVLEIKRRQDEQAKLAHDQATKARAFLDALLDGRGNS